MKTHGSMRGPSSGGSRTDRSTGAPPPAAPSFDPLPPAPPRIVEEETYHLLVDAGLERRFREIHEAVAETLPGPSGTPVEEPGGPGRFDGGIEVCPRCGAEPQPQAPSYRVVLRCTHSA